MLICGALECEEPRDRFKQLCFTLAVNESTEKIS